MVDIDASEILKKHLTTLDEDIIEYLVGAVDGLSITEKKNSDTLYETIGPFLLDTGAYDSEEAAQDICKKISIDFGGSGFNSSVKTDDFEVDTPVLLSAPKKMSDNVEFKKPNRQVFSDVTVLDSFELIPGLDQKDRYTGNSAIPDKLDIKSVPTTQRELRKQRKANEQVMKILRAEALERARAEEEMAKARMAAIKASRSLSRQSNTGVNIENFYIPHPSGSSDLLSDASLTLAPGHRYGLIGKNGAGKSTLMRAIAHYKLPNLNHLKILLVDQHVEGDEFSPLEWVLKADVERVSLLEDEKKLTHYMTKISEDPSTKLPSELKNVNLELALAEVYDRMELIGVHSAEKRARQILSGLGFTDSMMVLPTNSLSGGWAMRAALAAALFVKPNLLLLDEPTNHLDLHALLWLENWLTNYFTGIALIVSHDSVFLDAVCTDILELRSTLAGQSTSSLTAYSGSYSTYEKTLAENRIAQQKNRENYEREKEKLIEFISREGKKYDNPAHQSQRKMKIKQLEKLQEIEKLTQDSELSLKFPVPYCKFTNKETLLTLENISFSYPHPEHPDQLLPPLFSDIYFNVQYGDRIVIVGANGTGKTSLLNVITGDALATTGNVKRNLGSRLTVLRQHHYQGEQLDPSLNAMEHMRRLNFDDHLIHYKSHHESNASKNPHHTGNREEMTKLEPGSRQEESLLRNYLAGFGLTGTKATLPVKHLSGGQRMRLAMAVALHPRPDFLILDEPTNHLDSDSVRALSEAIEGFEGAVITVSHDETFVNTVLNSKKNEEDDKKTEGQLWVLENKKFKRYDGDFLNYKKEVRKFVLKKEEFKNSFEVH